MVQYKSEVSGLKKENDSLRKAMKQF